MPSTLAPILLFTYKRIDTLKHTVAALQQNYQAGESELFIFSDAAKTPDEEYEIANVRNFIKNITGFKNVSIFEANKNKGLANSIISGVTRVIEEYEKVIVLEDDLLTSPNFLVFMNQALEFYQNNFKVFSIAGYTISISPPANYTLDVYFTPRASSWAWASWKDRWCEIDWSIKDFDQFKKNKRKRKEFKLGGSDMFTMLTKQMQGKLDSWAIRWCYHQFKHNMYTVYPTVSKVRNIGFGHGATHTFDYFNRYETKLDESGKVHFVFDEPYINKEIIKAFLVQFSLYTRIKYKVLNTLALFIIKRKK